ncbi:CAZyme family GH13 [Paecilomyces variotii]|nr:CAZyme family GH13 [Paecilomyces variotii]KAJ9286494.1 CAZyme family GH13 [Paecilomyces variotii]KAJ9401776.1 CAZyme family GH13 [Paecilomyces variotii]
MWLQLISVLSLATSSLAASTEEWKGRSVYQVFTDRFARTDGSTTAPCNTTEGLYCGGTWRGIINHLDYIEGMGFDAIMISPIVQNIEGRVSYGEAYHGYWPQDIYTLNDHFGSHQDLLDLGNALHERGMWLMIDTVINNMAYITNGSKPATSINYSIFTPFNNEDYFHPYCEITNYENYPLAQRCWTGDDIVPLPDLKTESSDVQSILEKWIQGIISTYSVDGLRIDAAKHVTPSFLPNFYKAAGLFMTGEVMEASAEIICNYQSNWIPSVPNYPVYYAMLSAFTEGNITALADELALMSSLCPDTTALASFSENHDVGRIASMNPDMSLAKNILAFTILADGVPMIYQGQEQHFTGSGTPDNRKALWLSNYDTNAELYQLASILNKIRKQAMRIDPGYLDFKAYPIYSGSSELVIRKGSERRQIISVLSSNGENGGAYDLTLPISYEPGSVVTEVINCVNYTVDDKGQLQVPMNKGLPRILFPADQMGGSGLCNIGNWTNYGKAKKGNGSSAAPDTRISLSALCFGLFISVFGSAFALIA